MSLIEYPNTDRLATLACQKGTRTIKQREACQCQPCVARFEIFGQKNMGVPAQESRRTALSSGKIANLKQPAPEEHDDV